MTETEAATTTDTEVADKKTRKATNFTLFVT